MTSMADAPFKAIPGIRSRASESSATSRPTFTLRPPMPVTKQSPMPGISSSRNSLSLVPEDDLTAADAVALGLVALAFEVLDERLLERPRRRPRCRSSLSLYLRAFPTSLTNLL
jgi:hypothetical protein